MNLWRYNPWPETKRHTIKAFGKITGLRHKSRDSSLPEIALVQAKFCGGTRAGTWQWSPVGSILLSACVDQLLPTSGHALGCQGLCLVAFAAGPGARQVGPDDTGWQGGTDPHWRGTPANQMWSAHPPRLQPASAGEQLKIDSAPRNKLHIKIWMAQTCKNSLLASCDQGQFDEHCLLC